MSLDASFLVYVLSPILLYIAATVWWLSRLRSQGESVWGIMVMGVILLVVLGFLTVVLLICFLASHPMDPAPPPFP
jgi:hypothetical protein